MDMTFTPAAFAAGLRSTLAHGCRTRLRRYARLIPFRPPPIWKGQILAILCVMAGTGLRFALEPVAHGRIPVVIFYPFVLIASIWGGALSGLTSLVLGASVANAVWMPKGDNTVTLTAFSMVCLFGLLVARLMCAMVSLHAEEEERAMVLAHEVNHRANNLLGVVQAISAQTARNAQSVADHQALFEGRLTALAGAQQLISRASDTSADLRSLLLHIVQPFGADRFVIDGPAVALPHYLTTYCALLLHELSTNATKYGSLSAPQGKVTIRWEQDADGIRLEWREQGGPPVAAPSRSGFGSRLLKAAFAPQFGVARIAFEPEGVRCTVSLRLAKGRRATAIMA
jgi:two-component sensor histidine kinase